METVKTIVHTRTKPCNCGCKGADPWHKKTFKRVVTVTSRNECNEGLSGDGFSFLDLAQGVAKFPWGKEQVVLRGLRNIKTGETSSYGWWKVGIQK